MLTANYTSSYNCLYGWRFMVLDSDICLKNLEILGLLSVL